MEVIQELDRTKAEPLDFFDLQEWLLGKRYAADKWSIKEVLHHVCDAETVLFDRIRRVISERRQVIWGFDQDAWANRLQYKERPLAMSRNLYEATRNGVIHYAERHYHENGHLEFVHSETGVRRLKDEFDKVAHHNRNHLDHIKSALTHGVGHPHVDLTSW